MNLLDTKSLCDAVKVRRSQLASDNAVFLATGDKAAQSISNALGASQLFLDVSDVLVANWTSGNPDASPVFEDLDKESDALVELIERECDYVSHEQSIKVDEAL